MNKKKSRWMMAGMMVMLLIACSGIVLSAPQILSVLAKGTDNIDGIIRPVDALTFEARITNDGNPVDPTLVRVGGSLPFTSCTQLFGENYQCTVMDPSTGTASIGYDQAIPFEVSMLNQSNAITALMSGMVLVDSRIPQVSFASVNPPIAARENIVFNYAIEDSACGQSECLNSCSGIKKVEFFYFQNGTKEVVQTLNLSTHSCTVSSTISFPSSTFPEGPNALYIQATDMVDQPSEVNSIPFTVDNVGPGFSEPSFSLKYRGREISHYKSGISLPITIALQINDAGLDAQSMYADLGQLNQNDPTLRRAVPSCVKISASNWNCTWNINMLLESSGPKQIVVNASDTEGNPSISQLVRSFSPDDTGPTLSSISAGNANFASPLSTFTGQVVESGIGVFASEMKLRVGSSVIPASSCNDSICRWENIALPMGTIDVSLDQSSTDILGNAAQNFSGQFVVTTAPPQVVSAQAIGVGGLTGIISSFIATGDKVQIVANITEDTSIASATADLSEFISGMEAMVGECSNVSGNSHICTWISDPIEMAGTGQIVLTLKDAAGNSINHSIPLRIYSTDNNVTPDYWSSEPDCTPSVLDRMIGPLINQKSYCTIRLDPLSSGQQLQTVSMELAGCTENTLIEDSKLFNTQNGSTSPLLKLTLAKNDMKVDEIRTTCTVNIFSKVGDSLTRVPEEEQVQITLQFFNNPLGTIDESVQAKLDKALESTEGLQGFIGTLTTVMHYAEQICKLIHSYYNLVNGLYTVATTLGIFKDKICSSGTFLMMACPPLQTAAKTSACGEQGLQGAADNLLGTANKFCKYVSCEWTLWGDWYTSAINSVPGIKELNNWNMGANDRSGETQSPEYNSFALAQNDYELKRTTSLLKEQRKELAVATTDDEKKKIDSRIKQLEKEQTSLSGKIGGLEKKAKDSSFSINTRAPGYNTGIGLTQEVVLSPRDSLVGSVLGGCIPGIIEHIDKYRQINCLYADCIQTAVMEDNVPLKVCEDLKAEATCKYVMGEAFAVIPYTAIFDKLAGQLKSVLSNPLNGAGVVLGLICPQECAKQGTPLPSTGMYTLCNGAKLASKIGYMVQEVMGIVQQGFFPPKNADYCQIVKDRNAGGGAESKGLFGGLFGG